MSLERARLKKEIGTVCGERFRALCNPLGSLICSFWTDQLYDPGNRAGESAEEPSESK